MIRDEKQKEALEIIENNNNLTIAASVGFGKTNLTLKYLESKNYKTLIVCSIPIQKTWLKELNDKYSHLTSTIEFTTFRSLIKKDLNYDCLVIDECHNLLETHLVYLENFKNKIIGLTGTPPKQENSIKYRILKKYLPIKFEYYLDEAITDKVLNDYQIYIHKLELNDKKNFKIKTKKGFFFTSEIDNYNYWSNKIINSNSRLEEEKNRIFRMRMIMSYDSKVFYCKKLIEEIKNKCLIFCSNINQAEYLCNNSYTSKNKKSQINLDNFINNKITKLSCVNQLSEGVNIPNLKNIIILHSFGNEFRLIQKLGRAVRLNPKEISNIHILCYKNTIDEKWVAKAISHLNTQNIKTIE